ncbi:MAG TPA: hypothetical protein VGI92_00885 [Gemmatimonadales bacterium]
MLYFDNATHDSADAYLADGLTEEVILRLQQLQRLEVKSRYESQRVRAAHQTAPAAVGRILDVRYLVNGSVQRAGSRVVVRVALTRADRGVDIWSERYDQTNSDVLDVIDAIARGVATGVAGRLLPAEAANLSARPTADPIAYQQFLRGNFFLAQRSASSLAAATDAYAAALARDSTFKPALARIAYAYSLGVFYGIGTLSTDTILARAASLSARAIREAPELSDPWLAAGFLQAGEAFGGLGGGSMIEARRLLARAVAIEPNSPEAHHQLAQVLFVLAEDSLAEAEYRRALAIDPARAVSLLELSILQLVTGRAGEARRSVDSAIALEPGIARAYEVRAAADLELNDSAGARADIARGITLGSGGLLLEMRAFQALVLAKTGDTAQARQEVRALAGENGFQTWPVALATAALNDTAATLDALRRIPSHDLRCYAVRFPALVPWQNEPSVARITSACPWRRPH